MTVFDSPKDKDRKHWSLRLFQEGSDAELFAVDSITGEKIAYLLSFTKDGGVYAVGAAKESLEKLGYDPYEHGNKFNRFGCIVDAQNTPSSEENKNNELKDEPKDEYNFFEPTEMEELYSKPELPPDGMAIQVYDSVKNKWVPAEVESEFWSGNKIVKYSSDSSILLEQIVWRYWPAPKTWPPYAMSWVATSDGEYKFYAMDRVLRGDVVRTHGSHNSYVLHVEYADEDEHE